LLSIFINVLAYLICSFDGLFTASECMLFNIVCNSLVLAVLITSSFLKNLFLALTLSTATPIILFLLFTSIVLLLVALFFLYSLYVARVSCLITPACLVPAV